VASPAGPLAEVEKRLTEIAEAAKKVVDVSARRAKRLGTAMKEMMAKRRKPRRRSKSRDGCQRCGTTDDPTTPMALRYVLPYRAPAAKPGEGIFPSRTMPGSTYLP
jgi:hypothetical protein